MTRLLVADGQVEVVGHQNSMRQWRLGPLFGRSEDLPKRLH
jgi:hypothetical protein